MLRVPCPCCGPRDENEFAYIDAAGHAQPTDPDALSDTEWTDHLYLRDNPRGPHIERWLHRFGCRRSFVIQRDTLTHAIEPVPVAGSLGPDQSDSAGASDERRGAEGAIK